MEHKPFTCIGCGAEVAEPNEQETKMLRAGGAQGYCADCMGGRARKVAADLLQRFERFVAELDQSEQPLDELRVKLQTAIDAGVLLPELAKRARACVAILDELQQATAFAAEGRDESDAAQPPEGD